ncbi:MAG TPA: iron-sulfur cluster assembly scaffold protein [Chloroflexota bacterium]
MRDELAGYSDTVIDHATNPRNVGALDGADGVGADGNAVYGNLVRIYLAVADGRIQTARFKAFGCSATIAAASMTTELVRGATLTAARALSPIAIEQALGTLPVEKRYCAAVAATALHRALDSCASIGSGQ